MVEAGFDSLLLNNEHMLRNQIIKVMKNLNLRWWINDHIRTIKNRLEDFKDALFHKPIYYEYFSRDCDMCESSYCAVFRKGKKAFEKMKMESYEWAEGPMSFTPISKADYEQWHVETNGRTSHRDRVMEAYENGRGNSIYV